MRPVRVILLDQMVDRGRPHERLIGEHYQHCLRLWIDNGDALTQRSSHPFPIRFIDYDPDILQPDSPRDLVRGTPSTTIMSAA